MSACWTKLQAIAQAEVEATLAALPDPLRRQAAPLPVAYQVRPDDSLLEDGYDPDLLGLFVGAALAEPDDSPLPPQIILYLENIWDFAEADEQFFRDEIRMTYLHELGHYLGLDEIDLDERGLS